VRRGGTVIGIAVSPASGRSSLAKAFVDALNSESDEGDI
jgi:pantothenate kinase